MVRIKAAYISLLTQAFLSVNDEVTIATVRENPRIFPRDRPLSLVGNPSCVMDELLRSLHAYICNPESPDLECLVFESVLPALRSSHSFSLNTVSLSLNSVSLKLIILPLLLIIR